MSDLTLKEALRYVGRDDLAKTASNEEHYTFSGRNATFISYIAAHVKTASGEQLQKCEEHARFWQIDSECKTAVDKLAEYGKDRELTADDFTMILPDGTGKFAAYDADTTVTASIGLVQNRHKYPLEWRKTAAVKLLNRAVKHAAHVPEFVEAKLHKMAGLGYASPTTATEMLVQRLNLRKAAGVDELSESLTNTLSALINDGQLCLNTDIVKTAVSAIEDYDAAQGITQHYGTKLAMPEELIDDRLVTSRLEKAAHVGMLQVELTNGVKVNVSELPKEALAAIDDSLATMKTAELIEVLPTLPRDSADLLMRLI